MVGATGFEPTTPWSQARCSTKLSYAPILTSSHTIILRHFIVVLMRNTSKLYMKSLLSKNGATGGIRTPDPRLRRPLLYPTELQTRKVVGATGFEPTTPWSQARCSTKLSYAPTTQEILCHISQLLSRIFSSFSKARLSSFLHNIYNYTSTQKQMQAFFNTATKNFYPAKDSRSACISISL